MIVFADDIEAMLYDIATDNLVFGLNRLPVLARSKN